MFTDFLSSLLHLESNTDISVNHESESQQPKRDTSISDLGPLKDNERRDLNCAVKEYLLIAGYRLTAMTFYEEVYHFTSYQISFFFFLFFLSLV